MPANLKSGPVKIISLADGKHRLGVKFTEPSLQPVIIDGPANEFTLKKTDSGDYHISVGGYAFTGILDDVLIASVNPEQDHVWKITHREPQDAYTIGAKGHVTGWTVPSQHDVRPRDVKISPIISTKSIPPQFLPTQLFRFEYDE